MEQEIKYDNESIIIRIKNKLESHNISSENLFQILQENKAYLSGSYLLQSICGTDFGNCHIDIFVLTDSSNININLETQISGLFTDNKTLNKFTNHDYSFGGIKSISIFNKIKIIYINTQINPNIKTYINKCNLDICSNYFDGIDLYIKNLDSIINKYAEFFVNPFSSKSLFNIKCNNFRLIEPQKEKIKKFSSRGFNIKVNFSHNNIYDLVIAPNNKNILNKKVIINKISFIDNLPCDIEKILVYNDYECEPVHEIDLGNIDFPPLLKEIRFFHVIGYKGTPKLPYGCKLYINDIRRFS